MIHHIGIAVSSIEETLPFYRDTLGFEVIKSEIVVSQGVTVLFLHAGAVKIELLEPLDEDSPVANFIRKRGQGIHHLAVVEGDIDRRLQSLKQQGFALIDEVGRLGADGNTIGFLHPKATSGVLIELCQPKER